MKLFSLALAAQWTRPNRYAHGRAVLVHIRYEPGDYSRAALAVLDRGAPEQSGLPEHYDSPDNNDWTRANYGIEEATK